MLRKFQITIKILFLTLEIPPNVGITAFLLSKTVTQLKNNIRLFCDSLCIGKKFREGYNKSMNKKWLLPIFASFMLFSTTNINTAEAASKADLTDTASKYLGVPYKYGGTTTSGFDCSGFTSKVFSDLGIQLNRTSGSQYQQGTAVAKSDLQVGDLVFFNTSGSGISHVGIYIGDGKMIHSQTGQGVSYSNVNDPYYWGDRYVGAKRVATFDAQQQAEVKSSY